MSQSMVGIGDRIFLPIHIGCELSLCFFSPRYRGWEEVIPSLKSMVQAAKVLREEINANAK